VFEHFRQEDGATTRQFGGLGLGLAIVRQIVELHGGRVSVTSPGERQGATFTVQIPLARQPIVLPDSEPVLEPPLDLQGIQVLVVDDEPDSREFVAFTLEQANATVTTVPSGIEALQSISHHIPDVVISDIGMPDMDGYMLIQQIQQRFPDRAIAVIALTAYAGETNQVQALAAGFQQHLAKPVEPVELIRAVILALGCNKL
jgi:CheY-like chemotaxis protein